MANIIYRTASASTSTASGIANRALTFAELDSNFYELNQKKPDYFVPTTWTAVVRGSSVAGTVTATLVSTTMAFGPSASGVSGVSGMAWFNIIGTVNSVTSSTGRMQITGLPLTPKNRSNNQTSFPVYMNNHAGVTGQVFAVLSPNSTTLNFYVVNNGVATDLNITADTAFTFNVSGFYEI